MAHEKGAHEIEFSDNILWYGIWYTVIGVVPDYDDGTVLFKLGYPRRIDGTGPILQDLTTQLSKAITVMR